MQLSAGFAAVFLAVAPVYAETNPTMSQPVSASKKGNVILPKAEPSGNISVPAERDNANANPAAELKNAPTSLTVGAHEAIAPYVGQTITKVTVTGNSLIKTADVMTAVRIKPGTKLTEEGINKDYSLCTRWAGSMIWRPVSRGFRKASRLLIMSARTPFTKAWKLKVIAR